MVKTNPLFFGDGIYPPEEKSGQATQSPHKKAIKRASQRTKLHRIILYIRNTHKGILRIYTLPLCEIAPTLQALWIAFFFQRTHPKAVLPKKRICF